MKPSITYSFIYFSNNSSSFNLWKKGLMGCLYSIFLYAIKHNINYSSFLLFLVSRHRTLMNIFDKAPNVDKDAFIAPSASVIGDVHIGRGSSIWYGCVMRGKVFDFIN
jgi:hypothetical protein